MCLIAVAWEEHPRYRLALIANRDELHARPAAAAGPDPQQPELYGGRDLQMGGSWLMASRRGRLAAVTNVRVGLAGAPRPKSRGDLVRGFAGASGPAPATLDPLRRESGQYAPFNLLGWDGDSLTFASNHPDYRTQMLRRGIHAMSNGALDAPWPKSNRATQALSAWLQAAGGDAAAADVAPLLDALADDEPAPDAALPDTGIGLELERRLSPPFVRDPRYGTRCSTVVLVEETGMRFVERRFGLDGMPLGESDEWLEWLTGPATTASATATSRAP